MRLPGQQNPSLRAARLIPKVALPTWWPSPFTDRLTVHCKTCGVTIADYAFDEVMAVKWANELHRCVSWGYSAFGGIAT